MKSGTSVPSTMSQPSLQAGQDASCTQALAASLAWGLDQWSADLQNLSEHVAFSTQFVTSGTVPKPIPSHSATFNVLAAFP